MAYQQKTMFILCIIIIVLNLLIYVNSEYIFNMLLYNFSTHRYNGSLLNVGYAPLSLGNSCQLKYSNQLYTKILTIFKKHVGDISKLTIVELPCVNINSGNHILRNYNIQKIICITPLNKIKQYATKLNLENDQLEYILSDPNNINNINKLKNNTKTVDLVLSIQASKLKYKYNEIAKQLKQFISPGKYWIIADIFDTNIIPNIKQTITQNNFKILETMNITYNILNSLEYDSDRKEQFIINLPIIKEHMSNMYITKDSNIYKDLQNNKKQYLVIISQR